MTQLLSILVAVVAGHACKRLPLTESLLTLFLNISVLIILFVMGYAFGSTVSNLISQTVALFQIVATFTILLFIFNFSSVYLFIVKSVQQHDWQLVDVPATSNILSYCLMSLKYLLYLLAGIAVGYYLKWDFRYLDITINFILFIILFIIGHQLRLQGIALKSIFVNKLGMMLSLCIIFSSLLAGVLAAKILNMTTSEGLMLSSGFGWYTLSGILSSQLINHEFGTASFFIDFIREIIAIILIPTLGAKYPLPMIGYSGATALDFTLPIIKVHIGDNSVPVAVTSGMILTILVPILMPLFHLF